MAKTVIKNGLVIDPAAGREETLDIKVEGSRIVEVAPAVSTFGYDVIDASGKVVTPGLIDIHCHFREPGNELAETIESGSRAAVAGGFSTACVMPNTTPPIDTEAQAEYVLIQGERAGHANIFPIAAITKGRKGKMLSEMGLLVKTGAVAFSDDGDGVQNAEIMRRALQYSKMFDKPIISHAEDANLRGDGVINSGFYSMKLALPGIPSAAEEVAVARDIILARETGGKLHIAHVSTRASVDLIRRAKAEGVRVTCETCPHYFTLTEEKVETFETCYKVNPPLRGKADREAIIEGLGDGTIDVISSDHAPHTAEDKALEFLIAPFGMIGIETMLPLAYTHLVKEGVLSLGELIAKMTVNPAGILGISKGSLAVGGDADITILDLDTPWKIDAGAFKSKSRNCPFDGWEVFGRAAATVVGGRVHRND